MAKKKAKKKSATKGNNQLPNENKLLQFKKLDKPNKIDCTKLPEIALNAEMKEVLRKFLENNGYKDVNVLNQTTGMTIESSNNTVYIPNQYFLIAAKTFDYAVTLAPYVSFYVNTLPKDVKIKVNSILFSQKEEKDEKNDSGKKKLTKTNLNSTLFSNVSNRNLYIEFLNLASKRLTNEKGEDRSPDDIFKSYYLKKIGFPDASSETLSKIVWYLTQNMEVYKKLKDELADDVKAHNPKKKPEPTEQLVYYGIPGCGKSHEIKQKLQKVNECYKIRTVFHPEYSNAEFVGQIYPFVKSKENGGGVDYRFKPGPFARAIRKAYHDPKNQYYLCIEEINRGNAAAIFGEMFQLLDRIGPKENPETTLTSNCYGPGWSAYGVNNDDLNDFILEENEREKLLDGQKNSPKDFDWKRGVSHVHFSSSTEIRLPPNLTIYATMNTSDQNVFSLDNAFQRRFNLVMIQDKFDILDKYEEINAKDAIKNQFGSDLAQLLEQYNKVIGDSGIRWGRFRHWINNKIMNLPGMSKADDKRLGAWFITSAETSFSKKDFAEKVFKYLRNDVFKSSVDSPFKESKPLSEIIYDFENTSKDEAFAKVFKIENEISKLKQEFTK